MKNNFIVINTNTRTGLMETTTYTTLEGAEGLQQELLTQGQPSLLIYGVNISGLIARKAFIQEQTLQEVADYEATQDETAKGLDSSLATLMQIDEEIAAIEAEADIEEDGLADEEDGEYNGLDVDESDEEDDGYGWGYEEGFDDDEEEVETLPEENYTMEIEEEVK